MARTREFDEDAALTAAMHVFRRKGYEGVSIKALERATGLSSGSLYNGFGSKDALFARTLDHYNRTVVRRRIREHLEAKPPAEGLRALFRSLLREPGGTSDGCLLTNSAVEFGADAASPARDGVRAGMALLETGFRAALDRLAAEPVAPARLADPAVRAQAALRLLVLYQGLLVLIRFGRPKRELNAFIDDEIDHLIGDRG